MKIWTNSEKKSVVFHFLPIAFGCKRALQEIVTFQGRPNLGYIEAMKCHFEARKRKSRPILTRIQSHLLPIAFFYSFKGTLLAAVMEARM